MVERVYVIANRRRCSPVEYFDCVSRAHYYYSFEYNFRLYDGSTNSHLKPVLLKTCGKADAEFPLCQYKNHFTKQSVCLYKPTIVRFDWIECECILENSRNYHHIQYTFVGSIVENFITIVPFGIALHAYNQIRSVVIV